MKIPNSIEAACVILIIGVGMVTSCTKQQPTAQVLTVADSSVGLNNLGTITNFPFANTNTTIFEDINRGTVCYILKDVNGNASMSCTIPKTAAAIEKDDKESMNQIQLVTPTIVVPTTTAPTEPVPETQLIPPQVDPEAGK